MVLYQLSLGRRLEFQAESMIKAKQNFDMPMFLDTIDRFRFKYGRRDLTPDNYLAFCEAKPTLCAQFEELHHQQFVDDTPALVSAYQLQHDRHQCLLMDAVPTLYPAIAFLILSYSDYAGVYQIYGWTDASDYLIVYDIPFNGTVQERQLHFIYLKIDLSQRTP